MSSRLPILHHQIETLGRAIWRHLRRVTILVIGSTVLVVGAAMVVLPGPGLLVIPVGLGILAFEFAFARRWLARLRTETLRVRNRLSRAGVRFP